MISVVTVRMPNELKEFLKDSASKQGLTRNSLVLQILWEWVNKNVS